MAEAKIGTTDLHAGKASHLSTPVDTGIELHLRKAEVGHDCEVGELYMIQIPMVVTSKDEDMVRFLQRGVIHVESEPNEKEKNESMPLDQLRKKIGTVKPGEEYK